MSASPPPSTKTTWLLGSALVAAALWAGNFHLRSAGLLHEREQANRRKIEALRGQLESARQVIAEIGVIERQAAAAGTELDRWSQERPTGPTVVWFPVWLKAQLNRVGIAEAQIRLNTEVPATGLPGFKRTCWNVNLPPQGGMQNMTALLLAVEEIEQRERFVKILDCSFRSAVVDPHWPAGGFNVEALIRE